MQAQPAAALGPSEERISYSGEGAVTVRLQGGITPAQVHRAVDKLVRAVHAFVAAASDGDADVSDCADTSYETAEIFTVSVVREWNTHYVAQACLLAPGPEGDDWKWFRSAFPAFALELARVADQSDWTPLLHLGLLNSAEIESAEPHAVSKLAAILAVLDVEDTLQLRCVPTSWRTARQSLLRDLTLSLELTRGALRWGINWGRRQLQKTRPKK